MNVEPGHPEGSLSSPETTVVGIGASAGGLAALREFFDHVPEDSGLVFVVVVHLSPQHESHLAELLQQHVRMPAQQVTESVPLEPNHVYVIPPNANLSMVDTHLRLLSLEEQPRKRAPIDHFFRTLAATHGERAIGVILTGTGPDGTLGIKAIKERGGLTVVQDPSEAEYDAMPQNAIATGLVDVVLPVRNMPDTIIRYIHTRPRITVPEDGESVEETTQRHLQRIFGQIRTRTGRDFSRYKESTIMRRIQRRMQLHQLEELGEYTRFLRENREEVQGLADDLLITVTSFFRDPEVYEHLEREIIPQIFEDKGVDDDVRVWSTGCATGEEAYSLAMLLMEESARRKDPPRVQLFASDLHENSLVRAREAFYPGDIETDVSSLRLKRFFVEENGGYRIRKEVREMIVFAPHNLMGDPPFSRLDLILCRNLLIYLQRDVQREVVTLFHYALRPTGFLVLGTSESIDAAELFQTVEKKLCIFRKRNVPTQEAHLPVFSPARSNRIGLPRHDDAREELIAYGRLHQSMLERLGPPSLLISPDDKVVHLSSHAGRYLVHPGGELTSNAFKLVRDELRIELSSALRSARSRKIEVRSKPVRVRFDGETRLVIIDVHPAVDPRHDAFALVLFDERPVGAEIANLSETSGYESTRGRTDVDELETELAVTKQRLQAIIEEYETSQEEMRASNEELQSTNEELRSTMEELETSKEELQSMNEELQTVNQENRHKVDELGRLSNDLQNLLTCTDIATLFLDRDLRILRFTPKVVDLFSVRMTDRGRPISDLTQRLGYHELEKDAARVLRDLIPINRELEDDEDRCYLTRVLPYRSSDDKIEGVVITFVEITERKHAEEELRKSQERLRRMVDVGSVGVVIYDQSGTVIDANDAFLELMGYDRTDVDEGYLSARKLTPREAIESGRELMEQIAANDRAGPYEKEGLHRDGSRSWMLCAGVALGDGTIAEYCIDLTARKRAEEALRQSELRLAQELDAMKQLHELIARLLVRSDLQDALDEVLASTTEITGAGMGIIRLIDRDGALRIVSSRGFDEEFLAQFQILPADDASASGRAIRTLEQVVIEDVQANPGYEPYRELLSKSGFRAVQSTPLVGRDGEPLGVLSTHYPDTRPPSDRDLRLLNLYARQAADFIEHIRRKEELRELNESLEQRVKERTQQVSELAKHLTMAEQEERHRISLVLHDDLQQILYAADLKMNVVERHLAKIDGEALLNSVAAARHLLHDAVSTTRRLTVELSPPILQGEGLADALEWLRRQMHELHGLEVSIEADRPFHVPAQDLRVLLFQVVRELLFNVEKHAGTNHATVRLTEDSGDLVIRVSDAGAGFRVEEIWDERSEHTGGFGLSNLRERLHLVGGTLEIRSTPGKGSEMEVRVPKPDSEE